MIYLKSQQLNKLVSVTHPPINLHMQNLNNFLLLRWCKVVCIEDNKSYFGPIAKLESDDGLGLSSSDIVTGKKVNLKYRRIPYEAKIASVYGNNLFSMYCHLP